MYGEIALFSGNGNAELAGEISAALAVPLCPADVFKFSNQNIFCRLKTSVRGKDVFIIQPIATSYPTAGEMASVNDNLMELLIMIDTAKRDSAGRITAVVPYYGYGRTDKKGPAPGADHRPAGGRHADHGRGRPLFKHRPPRRADPGLF